jgi:ATP-binding cassette subfamily F protein uup
VRIGELAMDLRVYLERFLFDPTKQRQKVGSLSGGERARVALAKALRGGANLLLLDEPTNDLDVAMLGELEELLVAWPGCAIAVSHDRAFLNRVATSILAFEGEGKIVHYPGNYDTYRSLRAEALAREAADRPEPAAKKAGPTAGREAPSSVKPLTFAERAELEGILDRITAAEADVVRIEAMLSDPLVYSAGPDGLKKLRLDYATAQAEVARLTARWEALESRRTVRR